MIVDLPLAPFSTLAFLGTCLFVFSMFLLMAYFQFSRDSKRARLMLKLLSAGIAIYVAALLGASAFSKEYVLAKGAEKHFCEIDCHLAYSVTKVEQVSSVPPEFYFEPRDKSSENLVVTLRTRFDETTIGPQRGNGPLSPNPREIYMVDEQGRLFAPTAMSRNSLGQPLRPGESYETRILFSMPNSAHNPKMFLKSSSFPNSLLIGHENSPLHRKAYFDLRG